MSEIKGSVVSLARTGDTFESFGWVAERVYGGAQKVVVIVVDKEGRLDGHGFGPVEFADLTLMAAYMNKRAMDHVDGGEE